MRTLWIITLLAFVAIKDTSAMGEETRLIGNMLVGYNKLVRPVTRPTEPLRLKLGVALREAVGLKEDLGQITVHMWLKMVWRDAFLQWNPVEYGGITRVYVTQDRIWTPDIVLYNALHTDPDGEQNHLKLVVEFDGRVTWVRPVTYAVTCKHEFRGNVWACPFTFGSWVYHGLHLQLEPEGDRVDIDDEDFLKSDHFAMISHKGKREVKTYKCCEEPYITMNYVVKLSHRLGVSLMGRK